MLTVDAVKCLALDPESYKQFFESAKVCVMSCMGHSVSSTIVALFNLL